MISITTIYLVRHAEAEGNLYRRSQGGYDALITERGYLQIDALQHRFEAIHIDAVYSSQLYRTKTTARAVYIPKNLPLQIEPELVEINMGDWEDKPWGEIYRTAGEEMKRYLYSDPTWCAPNGENFAQVGARALAALTRIAGENEGKTIAVFSHGTVIRQLLACIRAVDPADWRGLYYSDNTAVNLLRYDGGQWEILFENDTSHLPYDLLPPRTQSASTVMEESFWFRPLVLASEQTFYIQARRDAWNGTHIKGPEFQASDFLSAVQKRSTDPRCSVFAAMLGDEIHGILELDATQYQAQQIGYIAFFYLDSTCRGKKLGVQLLGQAISYFRGMSCRAVRLRCAPYNQHARSFYKKYGFHKVGEDTGARVPLDILEKNISPRYE